MLVLLKYFQVMTNYYIFFYCLDFSEMSKRFSISEVNTVWLKLNTLYHHLHSIGKKATIELLYLENKELKTQTIIWQQTNTESSLIPNCHLVVYLSKTFRFLQLKYSSSRLLSHIEHQFLSMKENLFPSMGPSCCIEAPVFPGLAYMLVFCLNRVI